MENAAFHQKLPQHGAMEIFEESIYFQYVT